MGASEAFWQGTLISVHALMWLRGTVVAVVVWIWSFVLYLIKHKGRELDCIQRDVKDLEKLPLHLAIAVNERDISHNDLARLVNWSFAAGVQYVSLYDPRGILRSQLESLRHAVEQEHGNLFPQSYEPVSLYSSVDQQGPHPHHGAHCLLVLCPEDGRNDVCRVATSLCESVLQHETRVEDIDPGLIDSKVLGTRLGYPDPNLLVATGGVHSVIGFLPWQMRLTEILFISSHHRIRYRTFYSILCRYATTNQRFGK